MSIYSTIGGVAKLLLGGATLADGVSDIRKERKRKQEEATSDDFYENRVNDNDEVIVESETED